MGVTSRPAGGRHSTTPTTAAAPGAPFRLDAFLDGPARQGRRLYRGRSAGHAVEVREADGLRWFSVGGRFPQSMMRLDDPAAVVMPNQLTMLSALTWSGLPARVLDLGAGCGTFERFFAARLPGCAVTAIERSRALVRLARCHFALPETIEPLVADAATWLADAADDAPRFDLVLCDIFDGEHHPDCLFDAWFYADCERRLARGGAFALNVSPTAEDELVEMLAALRQAFAWVVLAPVVEHGNVVVLAGPRRPPGERTRRGRARALATTLAVDAGWLAPAWERLPSRHQVRRGAPG
ncbi:MAG: methyltransferase domain-containing protein [Gammaproteobacteria bacterium]|nr:methyltransferase domain-containing protein [Gammaproteobacteria bacterium]